MDASDCYNSETRDALILIQGVAAHMLAVDAREANVQFQRAASTSRPEVCIEIEMKR